jgi:K(+)-stimulated pyrophosphate-energized sodium pump
MYSGLGKKPTLKIVEQSSTGAGTNIIAGLATGMISTFPTVLLFAAAIWSSYAFAGFYGVALAASAMMATTAMQKQLKQHHRSLQKHTNSKLQQRIIALLRM